MSSEVKAKAMPIPEKGQDRAAYEAEELSKPLYEGKVTFEMVANDPEYQPVRDHPNWKSMMAAEKGVQKDEPKDEAKMSTADQSKETKEEPVLPPKQDKPAPVSTSSDPLMALEVAEGEEPPSAPDMEFEKPKAEPKVAGRFEPHYNFKDLKLSNKFDPEVVGPFQFATDDGCSDLLNDHDFDLDSPKEEKLFRALQRIIQPATFSGIKRDDSYVPLDAHNITPKLPIQKAALDLQEYAAERVQNAARPELENPNRETIRRYSNRDEIENNGGIPITAISFPRDEEVVTMQVFMNPNRLPLMMQSLRAFKYLAMRRTEFLNPVLNPIVNMDLLVQLRQLNGGEEDKISNNSTKVARFERVDMDGGAYYYNLADINDLRLYSEIVGRSIDVARGYTDVLTPSAVMLNFPARGQIQETVAKLNQLGSGDAAEMCRELTTFYASGYACELEIDFTSMLSADIARLRPMCCMAYLLLLDKRMLSYDSHLTLLTGVLAPFYGEADAPFRQNPLGGRVEVRKSASSIARDFLAAGRANIDDLRNNFSLLLGGRRIANTQENERRYVTRILCDMINLSFAVRHLRIPRQRSMLNPVRGPGEENLQPFSPFVASPDASENVQFGVNPHYTADYDVESQALLNNLILFSEALSRRPEVGQMLPLMQHALRDVSRLQRSAALMVDSIIRCTTSTDCIPYRNNVRGIGALPLQTFTLPFAGALSLCMFGIESSNLENNGEKFIKFVPAKSIPLPSLYPLYVSIEKAIANEVYEEFEADRYHILIPAKLVSLCLKMLGVIFKQVDPASERRLTLMFDEYAKFLVAPNNVERIPAELKRGEMDFAVLREEMRGRVKYGLARSDDPLNGEYANPLRHVSHSINLKKRRTDRVYISVDDSIGFVTHINELGQNVAIYAYEEAPPQAETVSIDAVLDQLYSHQTMEVDVDSLRQLARRMGARFIEIDKLSTSLSFVEQKGYTDEPAPMPKIKVMRKAERAMRKFKVDLTVYYRMNHDEYSRDVNGVADRGMLNPMFAVYIGAVYSDLKEFMINYDGFKVDSQDLYNLNNSLRIMDGHGYIHSTPIKIATREDEQYTLQTELNLRI
jgi:hypothetical protein